MIHTIDQRLDGVRVALIGINFPPEMTGIAPYNAAMAQAMAAAGASVRVITGVPHYPMWKTQKPYTRGLRYDASGTKVRVSRRRHFVPKNAGLAGRALMEASFFAHSLPSIMRSRAEVIIAVTPSISALCAGVAGRRDRPVGVIIQDFTAGAAAQTKSAGSGVSGALAKLESKMLRSADLYGIITPEFAPQLHALGVSDDAIMPVPNFTHIAPARVSQAEARNRLGWPVDGFLVVHTGNMGMKQGLASVVDAARDSEARGEQINFVLVGDGNQRRALQNSAAGLSAVRFVDPLPEELYPYALAAADVLLLNESAGVKEFCMPSKLTSYVVADRPILVASGDGSITHRTTERHGFGLLVPPNSPEALLAGASRLRSDEMLRRRLTAAAGTYSPLTSREAANKKYVDFAARLAAG